MKTAELADRAYRLSILNDMFYQVMYILNDLEFRLGFETKDHFFRRSLRISLIFGEPSTMTFGAAGNGEQADNGEHQ